MEPVSTLEKLLKIANSYDYAVFVYGADDVVVSRGKRVMKARDNVVLEHGIFLGVMGRSRVFYLVPEDESLKDTFKIASDLFGTHYFGYKPPPEPALLEEDYRQLEDCVAPACDQLQLHLRAAEPKEELKVQKAIEQFVDAVGVIRVGLDRMARVEYVGKFPHFMSRINSMIADAKDEVLISCDALLYGHFSNPKEFRNYKQKLQAASHPPKPELPDVNIELIVHDEEGSRRMRELQFGVVEDERGNVDPDGSVWAKLMKRKKFQLNLRRFKDDHPMFRSINSLREFYKAVLQLEQRELPDFEKNVVDRLYRAPAVLPVNFWLVDREQVLFSLASQSLDTDEHGFVSKDPALVALFGEMWKRRLPPT